MGAFSHKFSIAPGGKTTDRNKLDKHRNGRTSSITIPSLVGNVPRRQ